MTHTRRIGDGSSLANKRMRGATARDFATDSPQNWVTTLWLPLRDEARLTETPVKRHFQEGYPGNRGGNQAGSKCQFDGPFYGKLNINRAPDSGYS